MDVRIVPYCEIDGVRTFRDSDIRRLWERLEKQGVPSSFKNGLFFRNAEEWLHEMKSYNSWLYVVYVDGQLMGCFWLNQFQERFCQFHYFIYKEFWGKSLSLSREILKQILEWEDKEGKKLFDMLLGVVHKENSLAVSFTKKVGGVLSHEIPCAYYDVKEGKSKPGYIFYTTLDVLRGKM